MQENLLLSPWQSEIWKNAYPYMTAWSLNYNDTDNSDFIPNPADSKVTDNIIVHYKGDVGEIEDAVYQYSDISGNQIYRFSDMKDLFVDAEAGNYEIKDIEKIREKLPGFESIPLDKIGIVK